MQRCIIHQVRHSLRYVAWRDRKAFICDLKTICRATTQEAPRGFPETNLLRLAAKGSSKYAIAVRSWENNWEDLATFFRYPTEIRRLIYTTNLIEGYHRQLRKVMKNKATFPTPEAAPQEHPKLLYVATQDITKKWTMPIQNWANILNQLVIRFEGRFRM